MELHFSIIIPVYNRPIELDELLKSIVLQRYNTDLQVIVIEDGSTNSSEEIVKNYKNKLNIHYYVKENSGPGLSRNFGMQKATGNYFIILDSDCILPTEYLVEVEKGLTTNYTEAFGGADAAHASFSNVQKAINYAMTSELTTGGLRGNKNSQNFQPRSFNMGLSKMAFEETGGFGKMHFGEDIDLTFRLWQHGYSTQFIEKAYVFHKRRINWNSFFKQTFNFGAARPVLNKLHPNTSKLTYWFPSIFVLGLVSSIVLSLFSINILALLFLFYALIIFLDAVVKNKNIVIAVMSIWATIVMFFGYGIGFLRSTIKLYVFRQSEKNTFKKMFG